MNAAPCLPGWMLPPGEPLPTWRRPRAAAGVRRRAGAGSGAAEAARRLRGWCRRGARAVLVLAAATLPSTDRAADPTRRLIDALLAPDRITHVTLSADGAHLAYVVHDGTVASLVIREVDPPGRKIVIQTEPDEGRGAAGGSAARFPHLGWANPQSLVYLVSRPRRIRPLNEELQVVDADGQNGRKLIDSEALEAQFTGPEQPRSEDPDDPLPPAPPLHEVGRPMQVLGFDGNAAIVEARGRVTRIEGLGNVRVETTVFRIDLATGAREQLAAGAGVYRYLYDVHGQPRVRETPRVLPPLEPPSRVSRRMIDEPEILRQEFEYRPAAGRRWRNLDELGARPGQLRFAHTDAGNYEPRSIPLALDREDVLYYASNVGRDTFGLYGINLASGTRTAFALETDSADLAGPDDVFRARALVFDRERRLVGVERPDLPARTQWFDPILARLQATADHRFGGRVVRILDWSDSKMRALLLVTGPTEPGRYFILDDGGAPQFIEVLRRLPRLAADQVQGTETFAFTTPAGVGLTGSVTEPSHPRVKPPPLLVLCRDVPGRAADPTDFNREAQALAAQGFLVLAVNHRGADGRGRRFRDAVRAAFDRVALEDVQAAITWVAAKHPFDRRRVAIMGHGFGGYLALRAAELFPGQFRCAVAVNAPVDLARWALDRGVLPGGAPFDSRPPRSEILARREAFFAPDGAAIATLNAVSVLGDAARLQVPVLILDPRERALESRPQGGDLSRALRQLGRDPQYTGISDRFAAGEMENAGRTFVQVGDFLNANLFEYGVRIGPERPVEDAPPAPAEPSLP